MSSSIRARTLTLALALGAIAPASAEVICHAEHDGPTFEDASSTGTAIFGIQFEVTQLMKVRGARIFTGESTATMSLSLYDDAGNTPGSQLTTSTFVCQSANDFQGTDFNPPAILAPGKYWLGFGTASGAQSPIDLPSAELGQPFRVSIDGGASWSDLFQSTDRVFKFRLMCNCATLPGDYGTGCGGSGGFVPELRADDCAIAGSNLMITIDQALGGSSATLFFGLFPGSIPIGGTGCSLLVSPLLPIMVTVPLAGVGPGAGTTTLFGPLPPNSAGFTFTMQGLIPDPGVPRQFAATNGLLVAIQ